MGLLLPGTEHARVELVLRYAPRGSTLAWDDPVYEGTFRWCDAIDACARDAGGRVWWGEYEDGEMRLVLRGDDPVRLWEAISPVVRGLRVLDCSDAWIRQGVSFGRREGPASRRVWWT